MAAGDERDGSEGGDGEPNGPTAGDQAAQEEEAQDGSAHVSEDPGLGPPTEENGSGGENVNEGGGAGGASSGRAGGVKSDKPKLPRPEGQQACPRCESLETKFCYYNNYNIKQPRYYCRVRGLVLCRGLLEILHLYGSDA
jgi:hypothetical protein